MKLFEPGKIGKLSLKNRIVMAPMVLSPELVETDGRISQQGIDYYVARARGGVGLIITGAATVNRGVIEPSPIAVFPGSLMADNGMYISRFNKLAEAVHDYGAKIALQLTVFPGRGVAVSTPRRTDGVRPPANMPRVLTTEEIERIVQAFGTSAVIASAAGMDAIEIHAHEGHIFDQFTTAIWNTRTDKYSGDLEGRLRFSLEVIDAIKKKAGADFPIIYRYGLKHHFNGGREVEEGVKIACRLEEAGVNAFDIDSGCWEGDGAWWVHPTGYQKPGCNADYAGMVRKAVKIPVLSVGNLGYPDLAESVLQQGKADFINLGRALLADPAWPIKVKEGRLEDIRPCVGCNTCINRPGKYLSCAVNPTTGIEREFTLKPAGKKKKVLVVGGGPGGMEAARVAALRGHKVTLWEKSEALGGSLTPASVPDFKHDYRRLIDYLSTQISKLGVTVELGKEATVKRIKTMAPEVIFIATGSNPIIPEIPGVEKTKVCTATDVLLSKKVIGENVVMLGGGIVGCETALYLARQGKKVTIVEIDSSLARDMFIVNRTHLMKLLNESGVTILTETTLREITDNYVKIVDKRGNENTMENNTVVLALGFKPNKELEETVEGLVPETYLIGDCVEPRKVLNAIWEGFRLSRLT